MNERWRAVIGGRNKGDGEYWHVSGVGSLHLLDEDQMPKPYSDDRWEFGNYFKTKEQAERARDLIKETLLQFHKDNNNE